MKSIYSVSGLLTGQMRDRKGRDLERMASILMFSQCLLRNFDLPVGGVYMTFNLLRKCLIISVKWEKSLPTV